MKNQPTEKNNKNKISDETLSVFIANAVLETHGVAGFGGIFAGEITKKLPWIGSSGKGIKIALCDEGYIIDVTVIIGYGERIPAVAWDLQENIKKEVEKVALSSVKEVNVHIAGVQFAEEV